MSNPTQCQTIIIGAGLVGLATAYQFLRTNPGARVIVSEKESKVGQHQSSHNSGVLHTGMYYKPGSLKAKNCSTGKKLLQEFCDQESVPYKLCGKVIVATSESQLPALQTILERGTANGVRCSSIDRERLREIEPHVDGVRAIHVPEAGIVDFPAVAEALKRNILILGGTILTSTTVFGISENETEVVVHTTNGEIIAKNLVNTAGLFADRVLKMLGVMPPCQIIPFRGEYYVLKKEHDAFCNALVYPVPNPDFPFLGVHYTRGIHGEVECGPNAVLALAREGYRWSDVNPGEFFESVRYKGLQKFLAHHWREGLSEIARSLSKRRFVQALQKLIPEVRSEHLEAGPTGVRAQALTPDGKLADDFIMHRTKHSLHVLNAPSPAATSCLSIGAEIVARLQSS